MPFNVELAQDVLAKIEANPKLWSQRTWRCGTSMCFAGWTAPLTEAKWTAIGSSGGGDVFRAEEYVKVPDGFDREGWEMFIHADREGADAIHVEWYAQTVLGLTGDQADELFDGDNDLPRLKELVAEYAAAEAVG